MGSITAGVLLCGLILIRRFALTHSWNASKLTAHRNLTVSLMEEYDANVRPMLDVSEPLFVHHFLRLRQIVYLDSKWQKMKTVTYDALAWKDQYLTWDPGAHGNISQVSIRREFIWIPDITVFNDVSINT